MKFITPPGRPTWAEIDLHNLVHNFQAMKSHVGHEVAIMPAVKADAYGHGAVECARALERAGADWFGVALPEEGETLREAGITRPILCLAGFWPGQAHSLIANDLTPALFQIEQLDALENAAKAAGRRVEYHMKVDTGMGRLGVPLAALDQFLEQATKFNSLKLDGVMTHLASADLPEQADFTARQISLFDESATKVRARGFTPRWIHEANGAAAHGIQRSSNGSVNLIRPGGVIYGLWRDVVNPTVPPLDWRPVLALRTRIAHLKTLPAGSPLGYGGTFVTGRPTVIATLPIGYEDGVRRALSNRGRVLVRSQTAPIVGRVSMDLTLVDVTEVQGVELGDDVTVIGRQGALEITAEDVASLADTISYEVTCGVGPRVPRVYGCAGE